LIQSIWLEHNWLHSYEQATVRIVLSELMRQDGSPMVQISRLSEVFQQGRPSRLLFKAEKTMALSELESYGLRCIANEEITTGIQEIETSV